MKLRLFITLLLVTVAFYGSSNAQHRKSTTPKPKTAILTNLRRSARLR